MSAATMTAPKVPRNTDTFPRWVLYCAGGIIAFALISVGLIRITGNGPDQRSAAVTVERSLRFEDMPDRGVLVTDGANGQRLTVLYGEQGFVRGVLRALSRERHSRGIGSAPPFHLTAHADGRVRLTDPATGERIDLDSFGPTNTAAFARFFGMRPE
jgi:putative photosynthetic complex assembly protein